MNLSLVIYGLSGRMGQAIERLARAQNIAITGLEPGAVVIDFTSPDALEKHLEASVKHTLPTVIGTTGFTEHHHKLIKEAAQTIPIVYSPNMSLGANLLMLLSQITAQVLPNADVEIVDIHHKAKKDSPGGTALALGQAIAKVKAGTTQQLERRETPRQRGEIGIFGLRGGGVVGEHTVYFFDEDERIELKDIAISRDVFAKGALQAAKWVLSQKPGLYSMQDVLGLTHFLNR